MGTNPPCCRALSPHHAKFSDSICISQLAAPQCYFPHSTSCFSTPFTSAISLNPLFSNKHLQPNACGYQRFSQKSWTLFNVSSRYACFLVLLLLHFTLFCKQAWLSLLSTGRTILLQLFLPQYHPSQGFIGTTDCSVSFTGICWYFTLA